MGQALAVVGVVALFAAVLVGLPRLAARARRGGTGGSVMGPFEEIWHPAAHRARIEVEVQEERTDAELPGDPQFRGRG
ncbi:hypothetical protein [Pseudonocardia humida]|uniref:Secreted protein n=1 Tax=Pseudonocardia humida TaxID=2800819 RepID=A0ABT0ZVC8_9PSEU|nr:hypothetical protein [Pseudonocardia humida]MCO1654691.1 hypothetical protein [Pseudonocardia humida]